MVAGILHGSIKVSSGSGTSCRLIETPTLIKYLWLEAPAENSDDVYIGGWGLEADNAPAIAKGTSKEFTFRHTVHESPCDLRDIFAVGRSAGDKINYLAITV